VPASADFLLTFADPPAVSAIRCDGADRRVGDSGHARRRS
jgi:hypothetical protein